MESGAYGDVELRLGKLPYQIQKCLSITSMTIEFWYPVLKLSGFVLLSTIGMYLQNISVQYWIKWLVSVWPMDESMWSITHH